MIDEAHCQRQRRPKPRQRRALALLAGCRATGCTEAVMVAHGFNVGELDELVRIGFATATTERGQTFEVIRFKITEAGERTLGG